MSEIQRWAEVSLWPTARQDFLLWVYYVKPEVPARRSATAPDPHWDLFAQFHRQTGGDFWAWVAKEVPD
jgi:hypothetical protein